MEGKTVGELAERLSEATKQEEYARAGTVVGTDITWTPKDCKGHSHWSLAHQGPKKKNGQELLQDLNWRDPAGQKRKHAMQDLQPADPGWFYKWPESGGRKKDCSCPSHRRKMKTVLLPLDW